ncbi:hypothetical protein H6P81_003999 [Aristolochia fimbriata]|uniref:Integrator complex subunit 7 n=1 Tax=Aristolochia fimbriata TaxID=158543 RepID=A0AAV7FH07_ARIFI|nr:hypothetical protein H6P81_003999 [Aristolochia fimbriata]
MEEGESIGEEQHLEGPLSNTSMEEGRLLPYTARLDIQPSTLTSLSAKDLIVFLVSAKKPSYRSRILNLLKVHALSNSNFGHLLHFVFLAYTRDIYPYVRKSALEGLISLIRAGYPQTSSFYDRAVELLLDTESVVRSAAVQVISEYGQKLPSSGDEKNQLKRDEVFIRLCSTGKDMNVEVRVEAFSALGGIQLVSEAVLLQTLSKKVLGSRHERELLTQCSQNVHLSLVSSAAGAFIHGLEDEFYEVRRSACASLGKLATFSPQFAAEASNFLVDLLNDDTVIIRLQTMETLFYMASFVDLNLQELHIHMLLNVLMERDSYIRSAARKLLCIMKWPDVEIFKTAVAGLRCSLQMYPQDRSKILSALFLLGKHNEKFTVVIVKEYAEKMEYSSNEELVLDKAEVIILLVLGLAANIGYDQIESCIPKKAFSYPLPLVGNMSLFMRNAMHPNGSFINLFSHDSTASFPNKEINDLLNQRLTLAPLEECEGKLTFQKEEALSSIIHTLAAVAQTWPLIKSKCIDEVHKILRNCKQTVAMMTVACDECYDVLVFASKYIKVINLLASVWEYVKPRVSKEANVRLLDLLLKNLERNLLRLKYSFSGLSKEENFHITELMLLTFVLRLSNTMSKSNLILKRIINMMPQVALSCEDGDIKPSVFVKELRKALTDVSDDKISLPFLSCELVELFSLEQIMLAERFKFKRAELYVPGNDSENPHPFVSGFPTGIKFRMILHNVCSKDRLWLQMRVEQLVEHVFVYMDIFEGSDYVKECTVDFPFYRTPKTASFSLWACMGLECSLESDILHAGGRVGPRKELTYLCKENEIFFASVA